MRVHSCLIDLEKTMNTENTHFIDEAFAVEPQAWGTYQSYSREGEKLITSLTESSCIAATRWYLKFLQDESVCDSQVTYSGEVGGKL